MKNFLEFYNGQSPHTKKISLYIFLTYFFVLFSYPLVRSATGAIFYDVYSSAQYSFATFIGVIALMVVIAVNNFLQSKISVHKIYLITGVLSILVLLGAFIGYKFHIKQMAFVLFATKEAYIVLLVHTCLAFANAFYNIDQFKRLIGPLGASGSLGGIIGGQLTSYIAESYNTDVVFVFSLVIILITCLVFYLTHNAKIKGMEEENRSITPIRAVRGVKKYVLLIGLVVALSQFVIFIADLQFNIIFEKVVTTKTARTAYLGKFYSYINMVSIFLQFVILPYLMLRVKNKHIFLFVPILYLGLILGGLSLGAGSLFVIGSVFVMMKGTDYSLFAAAKDVMYHPLLSLQKFGAKYITDMFVYRSSKALIAFVMAQFIVYELEVLSILQFIFLSLWIAAIVLLFREQQKLNH
jgi:AAA family ATP:ADP antiporter